MEALMILLGLITGSFINVCIHRLPRGESVVTYPSHCPGCKTRLGFLDLVPLLGYMLLRGRCRYCGVKISPRYPAVELLTASVFLLTYLNVGLTPALVKYLFLFSVLLVVSFIDLDHQVIPNSLVLVILAWGAAWQIFWPEISWTGALGGALLGGGFLLALAVVSRGGMGGGDIKLMFAAGFYLGPLLTSVTLFVGFISGTLVGLALIVLKLKSRQEYIPFGPFLCLGVFLAVLWGQDLFEAYMGITGLG